METLAAGHHKTGRRNWHKCEEFTDIERTKCELFTDGVTQAALSKLEEQTHTAMHPTIAACLQTLLVLQKNGVDVQTQIDTQLILSLLPLQLQSFFVERVTVLPKFLLSVDLVLDIGFIIRDIMMHKQCNEVLFKLYQYTMPFIKHNRLNFPAMHLVSKPVLMHMLQLVMLTCLGLHSPQCKTPTLHIRTKLFRIFTALTTQGSLRDIYMFCCHHNYLLRLSFMEHFVQFSSLHMSQELGILRVSKICSYDHCKTKRLVQYITDQFRTNALQNESLSWDLVEQKAQVAIERCNRTCKSQPVHPTPKFQNISELVDGETFDEIMGMPRLDAADLAGSLAAGRMFFTAARWHVAKSVCKYALPVFLQCKQFTVLQSLSENAHCANIAMKSKLYVCLRCNQEHCVARQDMRLNYPHTPICVHCNSSTYVFATDTLGHLIRCHGNYYYFCPFCFCVHNWQGTGCEFFKCDSAKRRGGEPPKHCAVCYRNVLLTRVRVLDKKLGLMQTLFLCNRHCPRLGQLQYVHDVASLRCLVTHVST